ncbi:hypothetical protein SDC9_142042 [bioreactor metagenome]|uniref:Uncharacterized protein n=1 Tax=bioreactor metagenome TaxID=1076179 RepID=A0A645E238_9ZZZZ
MLYKQPRHRQAGIDQQDDVQIVEMTLVPEQQQLLPRQKNISRGKCPGTKQIKQPVGGGPKEQGRQDTQDILRKQLPGRQRPLGVQQERAAAHEKQRHAGPGQAAPKEGRHPVPGADRIGKAADAGVNHQNPRNGGRL